MSVINFKRLIKRAIPEKCHTPFRCIYRMVLYLYLKCKYPSCRGSFECPCCRGRFVMFLPFGVERRINAQCPKCGALERHRLLCLYLKDKTDFFQNNLKVLHVAPLVYLRKKFENLENLDYISADISAPGVTIKMDITNINLPDDQFDCVICNHVLEHIIDDGKAMRELLRVLKPGGFAILQSPIDDNRDKTFEDLSVVLPKERERAFGQWDHVRIYGRDYKDRLEKAGFTVKLDTYAMEMEESKRKMYGVSKSENICYCIKPNLTKHENY